MTKSLISNYDNCRRNPQTTRCGCGSFPIETASHLLGLKPNRCKCHYCKNQGKEHRTFVKCNTFGVFLCLVDSASGRNYFYQHHLKGLMNFICFVWYYKTRILCLIFVPLLFERWKTNNTFTFLYYSCVILQWALRDYKNDRFITYILSGRILFICDI